MSIAIIDSDAVPARRGAMLPAQRKHAADNSLDRTVITAEARKIIALADPGAPGPVAPASMPPTRKDHENEVVDRLRKRLEDYRHRRARQAGWTRRSIPTGLTAIDAALPHGGLPCGAVTEILSDDFGVGSMTLALRIARQTGPTTTGATGPGALGTARACANGQRPRVGIPDASGPVASADQLHPYGQLTPPTTATGGGRYTRQAGLTNRQGGPTEKTTGSGAPGPVALTQNALADKPPVAPRFVVVVDTANDFYPPAAEQHGVDLDRLIVVRVRRGKEAFWAVEQALRCRAVGVVIAPLTRLDEGQSRRLQLAAESTGCVGLILRPAKQRTKSFAAVRMHVTGVPTERKHSRPEDCLTTCFRFAGSMAPVIDHLQCHNRDAYWCRIELLSVREGMPMEPIFVDLHHETGDVPVHPVPVDRPATRTG